MKILYISLLIIFTFPEAFSQDFQWASSHNNWWRTSGSLFRMDTDNEGNVYNVGFSYGTINSNKVSGYLSKFDGNGNLKWEYELYYGVYGRAVKTDNEGNCIAGFTFIDSVFFLEQTFYAQTFDYPKKVNTLLIKLDKNGNLLWHFIIPGGGIESVLVNEQNDVFVGGSIGYFATFPDTTLQSIKNSSCFLLKLDKNGNYKWTTTGILNRFYNYFNNSFTTVGIFTDSITYNNTIFYPNQNSERGILLMGADLEYNVKWAKQLKWESTWLSFVILNKTTDNKGNIFLTGFHKTDVSYNDSTVITYQAKPQYQFNYADAFLIKTDRLGNFLWSRTGHSPQPILNEGITADTSGNVFITGVFKSEITFENTTIYGGGMFIAKYDKDGNLIWLTQPEGGGSAGTAMASDNKGNVYFGGKYEGEVSFGQHTLSGSGMFVGKYGFEEKEPVSVKEALNNEEGNLFIFPNPSSNQLHIKYTPANKTENASFHIYNSKGSLVHSQSSSAKAEHLKTLDVSNLSQGIYFLNVMSGDERVSRKFMINR